MAVDLQNSNSALVGFHCELRATVNGKDLDSPAIFDGYVSANQKTSLIHCKCRRHPNFGHG
jgi:hypothetical protein